MCKLGQTRVEEMFSIFEDKLAEHYQSKHIRTSQVQMAMDIAAFLHPSNHKRILFLEAPVGTGKSLGALIPALIETSRNMTINRKRVLYATATINLQSQLMTEEVPLLKKLKLLQTAILAKGKSHYYCHKEFQMHKKNIDMEYQEAFKTFFSNSKTGHRDEFEDSYLQVNNTLWDRVLLKVPKRECEECPYSVSCPSFLHRDQFLSKGNNLLITNHDQLIRSTLNSISEPRQAPTVPTDPGIIIIDEAHHFQENFLGQLQKTITIRELKSLAKHHLIPKDVKKELITTLNILEDRLKKDGQNAHSQQGRYPLPNYFHTYTKGVIDLINDAISTIESQNIGKRFSIKIDEFTATLEEKTEALRNTLDKINYVSWIVYDDFSISCISNSFPSDFRQLRKTMNYHNKIIVMSGTLTDNGDFDSLLNQWRIDRIEAATKSITSSFDYQKQSLIYIPKDTYDPRQDDQLLIDNQVGHIKNLIDLTQGRSLILATSKKHMGAISTKINPICDRMEISFLQQDQSGVETLTKQFKNDETSILIGTGSFFSGFSVPGKALVSVIFTRLPFPVPDDPFLKLIGEGYEDEFFKYILFPHMMVKLNQGIGRLIRDINDYGVITILDPRVFDQPYSKRIQHDFKLKGYQITQSYDEVIKFYKGKLAKGSCAIYDPYDREKITVSFEIKGDDELSEQIKKNEPIKVTKVKKEKITDNQKRFAELICDKKRVTYPKKRGMTPQSLYEFLYNLYYTKFKRPTEVVEQFPYLDENQRETLSTFRGSGERTFTAPRCTSKEFNCDGNCSVKQQERLSEILKQHDAKIERFFKTKGFCLLFIEPKEVIEDIVGK